MKIKKFYCALLIGLMVGPLHAEPQKLIVCCENQEVAPYWMGAGTTIPKHKPGISVELFNAAAKNLGTIKFEFVRKPWARCQYNLKVGLVDAIIGSYKPTREEIGVYPRTDNKQVDLNRSISAASGASLFYRIKGGQAYWSDDKVFNLEGEIAVVRGYGTAGRLKNYNISVNEVKNLEQAFRLLQYGRVGGVVAKALPAKVFFVKNPQMTQHFEEAGSVYLRKIPGAYVIFSHQFYEKDPLTAEAVWNEMPALRELIPNIAEKYFE